MSNAIFKFVQINMKHLLYGSEGVEGEYLNKFHSLRLKQNLSKTVECNIVTVIGGFMMNPVFLF